MTFIKDSEAQGPSIPIIDTHIHLFDPTRPQGVPWPTKQDGILYQPALPGRYRRIAFPLGVRGAIAIEASPWLEDNQWLLDIAAEDAIIVGVVGNLEPGKPGFRKNLVRFKSNPLFLGIRYGNLWNRNLGGELSSRKFIADLRFVADAGLSLDAADPDATLISDVLRLTDRVPNLRVIIDHLPQLSPPAGRTGEAYRSNLRELGQRSQVFVKMSEVLRHVNGRVPEDLNFYRPILDELWEIFGPDRLLYGSDWPNSDLWAPYPNVLRLVRRYFNGKGRAVAEKFFWKNSRTAYRWIKRDSTQ